MLSLLLPFMGGGDDVQQGFGGQEQVPVQRVGEEVVPSSAATGAPDLPVFQRVSVGVVPALPTSSPVPAVPAAPLPSQSPTSSSAPPSLVPSPEPSPTPDAAPSATPSISTAPAVAPARIIYVGLRGGQNVVDLGRGPVLFPLPAAFPPYVAEHDLMGGWAHFGDMRPGMRVTMTGLVSGTYTVRKTIVVPKHTNTNSFLAFGELPKVMLQTCIPNTDTMLVVGLY